MGTTETTGGAPISENAIPEFVSPYLSGLIALEEAGAAKDFVATVNNFPEGNEFGPEFEALVAFAKDYHHLPIEKAFHKASRRPGVQVAVYDEPSSPNADEHPIMANLLGIVAARHVGPQVGMVYEAIVTMRGHNVNLQNARLAGLYVNSDRIQLRKGFGYGQASPVVTVDRLIRPSKA